MPDDQLDYKPSVSYHMYTVSFVTLAGEQVTEEFRTKQGAIDRFRNKCADLSVIMVSAKGEGLSALFHILAQ